MITVIRPDSFKNEICSHKFFLLSMLFAIWLWKRFDCQMGREAAVVFLRMQEFWVLVNFTEDLFYPKTIKKQYLEFRMICGKLRMQLYIWLGINVPLSA